MNIPLVGVRPAGCLLFVAFALGVGPRLEAQPFHFPTANRALLEPGSEEAFFVGTADKPWTTGAFGCVRSDGQKMHEGLDIRCLQRDRSGEPVDPVLATAEGIVVYLCAKPALSNYGRYLVLRHQMEGIEVYSLYAHLSEIRRDLRLGQKVRAGERIATMGRSSNTRERISKERAHVHFELALLMNERFAIWHRQNLPGQRNDHGQWNGQNLLGIDPAAVFKQQTTRGANFSLLTWLRTQPELCRVFVRDTNFPWLRRYPALVRRNPRAEQEGVAGYEMALDFNGLPFQLVPRAASEIRAPARFQLLTVNAPVAEAQSCRHLVVRRHGKWELGHQGRQLLELLTF